MKIMKNSEIKRKKYWLVWIVSRGNKETKQSEKITVIKFSQTFSPEFFKVFLKEKTKDFAGVQSFYWVDVFT